MADARTGGPARAAGPCPHWCVQHAPADGAHLSAVVELPPHAVEAGPFPVRLRMEQLDGEPGVSITAEALLTLDQAEWLAAELVALAHRGRH